MNGEQPPKKKLRWPWILLGIFLFFSVVTVGGCVFAFTLLRQSVSVSGMSANNADAEFEKVRGQFAGQQPLIQMVDGRPQFIGGRGEDRKASNTPLKTMHIIAWDDDEGQLVRVAVPFWLLRLKSGPIRLSSYANGWDDRMSFRIEDLEKQGPGLLMDVSEGREGRVIIWVE